MADLDLRDIQGIIISGYDHLPYSAHLILSFGDPNAARRWLSELAGRVTTSHWVGPDGKKQKPVPAINVALTAFGLARLGLSESVLRTFPQEIQEGMAKPPRPRRMGDTGASEPKHWQFGGTAAPTYKEVHALLILQAPRGESGQENAPLEALCKKEREHFISAGIHEVVASHMTCQDRESKEHFGFRDAISQPLIEGSPNRRQTDHPIKAGEFILGYHNEYDVLPHSPMVPENDDQRNVLLPYAEQAAGAAAKDLGKNGSYLVLRKLQQDVAVFRTFLRDHSDAELPMAKLGAKMVGRWANGAPLALSDTDDPQLSTENNFGYADEDSQGYRCPMSAHVRRANPRDGLIGSAEESRRVTNRHRIIRRGVLFGEKLQEGVYEDDGADRGILFICINTDIERQFEFLQQTWINSPKFGAHYSDSDPIMGTNRDAANPRDSGPWTMTIPAEPIRRRIVNIPRFVTMRGGAYFFLPSMRALRFLGSMQGS